MRHHLDSQALGTPLVPDRTVKSVVEAIKAFQGAFIEGSADATFAAAAASIVKMLTPPVEMMVKDTPEKEAPAATLMRQSSASSTMVKSPRGGMYFQKALYDSLQGKLQEALNSVNEKEFSSMEDMRTSLQALLQGNATTEL